MTIRSLLYNPYGEALINAFTRIYIASLIFLISVIVARNLGVELRGEFGSYLSAFNFCSLMFGLSVWDALFRRDTAGNGIKRKIDFSIKSSYALSLITFLISFSYIFVFLKDLPIVLTFLISLASSFQVLEFCMRHYVISTDKLNLYNYILIISRTFSVIFLLIILNFTKSPEAAFLSVFSGYLIEFLAITYIVSSHIDSYDFDLKGFLDLLKTALGMHVGLVGAVLLSQYGQIYLSHMKQYSILAHYQIALQFIGFIGVVSQIITLPMLKLLSNGDNNRKVILACLYGTSLLWPIIYILNIGFTKFLVLLLFGAEFEESYSYIVLMTPICVSVVAMNIFSGLWIKIGDIKLNSLVTITSGILFAILIKILLPTYGFISLIYSSTLCYLIILVFNMAYWIIRYNARTYE